MKLTMAVTQQVCTRCWMLPAVVGGKRCGVCMETPCDNCIACCSACHYEETETGPVYDDHLCKECTHS